MVLFNKSPSLIGIAVSIIPSFEFATPFVLRTFYQRYVIFL